MKSISILMVLLLMITLTACALGTLSVLPKFKSPVSSTDLHRQQATMWVGDLKQTIAPIITTPFPPPSDLSVLSLSRRYATGSPDFHLSFCDLVGSFSSVSAIRQAGVADTHPFSDGRISAHGCSD